MSNTTKECSIKGCDGYLAPFSKYCESCLEKNPNNCQNCSKECGSFKFCYPCGQIERQLYTGKQCKTCSRQSKDYDYCYTCNQQNYKNKCRAKVTANSQKINNATQNDGVCYFSGQFK